MTQWQDEGIVLASSRFGESGVVLRAFTASYGLHAGLVRGGTSRKQRALFLPGNRLQLVWRARLADQLGSFSAELIAPIAALVMHDPWRLSALRAACALLDQALPERDPHQALYECFRDLMNRLAAGGEWQQAYVGFELSLLAALGFGLDLGTCAVTGQSTDLAYVSPKSGRAVARQAAGDFAPRLLRLPAFLVSSCPATDEAVLDGLRLTGFFLERHVFAALDRPIPEARQALVDRYSNLSE